MPCRIMLYFFVECKNTEELHYVNDMIIKKTNKTQAHEHTEKDNEFSYSDKSLEVHKGSNSQPSYGLINSVPANQRPVVSALLQKRQAQRIRSKSVVHHNSDIQKEGNYCVVIDKWCY